MAPRSLTSRFAIRPDTTEPLGSEPFGAWWPHDRTLADQLGTLFESWPASQPRISRVLYSPPDWDDRPRKVLIDGRWVKTGNFPDDDTHLIVLTLSDWTRRKILVIEPSTPAEAAGRRLDNVADPGSWKRLRSSGRSVRAGQVL